MMSFAAMTLVGMLIDVAIGWPDGLYRRISHPVVWFGAVISALEKRLNVGGSLRRRGAGAATVLFVLGLVGVLSVALQASVPDGPLGIVIGGILIWPFVAVRSMHDHVRAVARPLVAGDLAGARQAVAMIVGRDPATLDQAGVARAALESLAENTSDGIVAPLFWGAVAGLPGIAIYKAINTMDSMIGHRNDRYEDFGKVAARLDDLVNLVPARLTGLVFAVVSRRPLTAMKVMLRDAGQHRSPNAGWPEGAMAGGLAVRLSGPRVYGDQVHDEPYVNGECDDPLPTDLTRGLALYARAMVLCAAILLGLAFVWG